MLTVYTVLWGDKYGWEDVYAIKRNLRKCLRRYRFVCITDQVIHGVEVKPPEVWWPGWWQKVGLFKPGFAPGPAVYLDLDVVLVDDLTEWVETYTRNGLTMPTNWAQSGHGGCQSSVMMWGDELPRAVYDRFEFDSVSKRLWGDQEWITELRDQGVIEVQPCEGVRSYKYHCRNQGPPVGTKVVAFHGKPKPPDVGDSWVITARS